MSSPPTQVCRSPFSDSLLLMIPSTNYSFTLDIERIETSPNNNIPEFTIQLHVQEWYKLYVEPVRGHLPMTMDEDYLVSPKFTCTFKVPLFLLTYTVDPLLYEKFISTNLASMPIGSCIAQFIKPHIVHNSTIFAEMNDGSRSVFKMVYDVKVVKIDLADAQECDGYRRCGLI